MLSCCWQGDSSLWFAELQACIKFWASIFREAPKSEPTLSSGHSVCCCNYRIPVGPLSPNLIRVGPCSALPNCPVSRASPPQNEPTPLPFPLWEGERMFRNKIVVRASFPSSSSPFFLIPLSFPLAGYPSPRSLSASSFHPIDLEALCCKLSRAKRLACFLHSDDIFIIYQVKLLKP